jgi:23S rRNA pseudouridine1911/1915/1917 synthase
MLSAENLEILTEDDDLLIVNKPPGLICHPTKPDGRSSLVEWARNYLSQSSGIHLVNRLDRETSGVVVLAKHPQAARTLGKLWMARAVFKEYWAIVHGCIRGDCGRIEAPLGKDEQSAVAIKDCVRSDGVFACTDYSVLGAFETDAGEFTFLNVIPFTGRKHQIRLHLAHLGHPLVGDKLYGVTENIYLAFVAGHLDSAQKRQLILPHHALHARRVNFRFREKSYSIVASPPREFLDFAGDLVRRQLTFEAEVLQ